MTRAPGRRAAALAAAAGAAACGVIALAAPAFRDAAGELAARAVFPFAAGIALVLMAVSRGRNWSGAGAWLALLIVALGAGLALIEAPPLVAYQHLRLTIRDWIDLAAFAVLVTQALLVLVAARAHVACFLRWLRARAHPAALGVAIALVAVTSAAPSRDPVRYLAEMALVTSFELIALANVAIALRVLPAENDARLAGALDRLLGPDGVDAPLLPDKWVLWLAGAAAALCSLLALVVYELHPHLPDELVYLLHARYLAEGALAMPLPPVPTAFNVDLMHYDEARWFSPVPPGWPMILAIGARLGATWLVNPVLGGVAIVLGYLLAGRMFDRRTARLATMLLAASPWFLFMSMNLMPHALTLVCALAAALGVAHARTNGSLVASFAGGIATGAVSLIRPLEGLAVALLVGFWSLGARGRWFRLAPSVALVAGTVLSGALVFPYNAALTGSARVFPIMHYVDKYYVAGANDLGFGADRGLGWGGLDPFPGHGAADVAVNTLLNGYQVNVELFGWPTGAVLVLALGLVVYRRRLARADWWLVTSVAMIVCIHAFYWFSGGPDFGARYWYLIIWPLAALAARILLADAADEAGRAKRTPEPGSKRDSDIVVAQPAATRVRPAAAGLLLGVLALILFMPWRSLGKYRGYRSMTPGVRALARERGFDGSLVLVRGRRFPDYASAAAYNPIDLRGGATVYAWDASEELRQQLLESYPDRRVWIVDGPSLTRDGFRVAAGPMSVSEAAITPVRPDAGGEVGIYDPVKGRASPPPTGER